jgi:hypothetical protein
MADLVDWNPNTENTLRKKWDEKKQQLLEQMSVASTQSETNGNVQSHSDKTAAAAAPRVRINELGEMVIDEESLVVAQLPVEHSMWETVDEVASDIWATNRYCLLGFGAQKALIHKLP